MTRETGSKSKGLHIVVPSFDGHIYVIEGMLKCAERIDIGEHIYRYYMRRVLIVLYSVVLCCVALCYTAPFVLYFAIFDLKVSVVQELGYVSQRMCVRAIILLLNN